METATFEEEVKDGVKAIKDIVKVNEKDIQLVKSKQQELVENYDQLDKQTKSAVEDLTKVKNHSNSQAEQIVSLQKVLMQMKREERMAWGNPIERMLADEDKSAFIRAALRSIGGFQLTELDKKALTGELPGLEKRDLDTANTPGSTMINTALFNEIYDTLAQFGAWNTFGVRRLGTKTTRFPVKTVRPDAVFVDEAAPITADTAKAGGEISITVKKIAALLYVSSELLEDSEFDVAADVMQDFLEAYAYRLDYIAMAANAVADANDGGFTGVFNGGTAAGAGLGNTTVQSTDLEDWLRCLTTVDAIVLQRSARWWMHPRILVQALAVRDSNGRPIFLTAIEAPAPKSIGSILGYPVTLAHAAPSTNSAGQKVAVFGDPAAQVVGIRRDYGLQTSEHYRFGNDQLSFRGIGRAGVGIRRAQGLAVLTLAAA